MVLMGSMIEEIHRTPEKRKWITPPTRVIEKEGYWELDVSTDCSLRRLEEKDLRRKT